MKGTRSVGKENLPQYTVSWHVVWCSRENSIHFHLKRNSQKQNKVDKSSASIFVSGSLLKTKQNTTHNKQPNNKSPKLFSWLPLFIRDLSIKSSKGRVCEFMFKINVMGCLEKSPRLSHLSTAKGKVSDGHSTALKVLQLSQGKYLCIFKYSYTRIAILTHSIAGIAYWSLLIPKWNCVLFWGTHCRFWAAWLYYWTTSLKLCADWAKTYSTSSHSQRFTVKWAILICVKIAMKWWLYFNRHWQYIHHWWVLYLSWKALALLSALEESTSIKYCYNKHAYMFECLSVHKFWKQSFSGKD